MPPKNHKLATRVRYCSQTRLNEITLTFPAQYVPTDVLSWQLFVNQGSSGDERAMAKEVSAAISRNSPGGSEEIVAEGQEPIEFWNLLGGKAPYANDKR